MSKQDHLDHTRQTDDEQTLGQTHEKGSRLHAYQTPMGPHNTGQRLRQVLDLYNVSKAATYILGAF